MTLIGSYSNLDVLALWTDLGNIAPTVITLLCKASFNLSLSTACFCLYNLLEQWITRPWAHLGRISLLPDPLHRPGVLRSATILGSPLHRQSCGWMLSGEPPTSVVDYSLGKSPGY